MVLYSGLPHVTCPVEGTHFELALHSFLFKYVATCSVVYFLLKDVQLKWYVAVHLYLVVITDLLVWGIFTFNMMFTMVVEGMVNIRRWVVVGLTPSILLHVKVSKIRVSNWKLILQSHSDPFKISLTMRVTHFVNIFVTSCSGPLKW